MGSELAQINGPGDCANIGVLKRKLTNTIELHKNSSKRVKTLSMAERRLMKKVTKLKDIILELKSKDLITEELNTMLEGCSVCVGKIFRRMA